jgi:very-short-patch-repair endonuclease
MARPVRPIPLARSLRQSSVPAEGILWNALRNRALGGFKFRRQHPIGPYIVDFACVEAMIVVEADGESHLPRKAEDKKRTQFLASEGWEVQRFWNTEIYDELDSVKEAIYQLCVKRTTA